MEIETISNVNANYGSSENARVNSVPIETSESAKASVEKAVAADVRTVTSPGNAEDRGQDAFGDGKREHMPSEATINDAVSKANRRMERTRCEYSYHKETKRVSIKVLDADTDEVIREIPPEKSLDMLQKMWEMAGILVDEKR